MKKYLCTLSLLFILIISGTTIKAQNNRIPGNDLTVTQLKGLNSQSDLSKKIMLLNQEAVIRNIKSLRESEKKYDAVFSNKSIFDLTAASSDSAYVYLWNTDWDLKFRIYYFFGTSSIEVLQEKLSHGTSSWVSYSKRVFEYYSNGSFKKETDFFWQNSSTQWLPAYVEEYNSAGKNIELYSKSWNDTTEQFTGGYRLTSSYISDTLLSAEIIQSWEVASNAWINLTKTENTYTNQLITRNIQKIWKETDWVNDYSIEYAYSQFGDLLTQTGKNWDTIANGWVNDVLIERSYNSLGNVTNIIYKQWDTGTSTWVNDINRLIGYDASFRVSSNLTQSWNGTSWTDSINSTNSYDAQGNILQYLEQVWTGSAWINTYREVYTYASDKVTIKVENWNAGGPGWENDILITYFIDAEGYLITEQHEFWNTTLNSYETGYYDKYDVDGNNTEYYEKIWNDTLNIFSGGIRVLSTYDTNGIKQTIVQVWDTTVSGWKNSRKTVYFWQQLTSVHSESLPGSFKIYPSPFTDVVSIEIINEMASPSALKIIDLSGRIVYESVLTDKMTTLDLSHLNKGVYFAEINSNPRKSVIKIIKY